RTMKFVYLAKLVLKSALIIAILSSILLSLHGSGRFQEKAELDEDGMLRIGNIVNFMNITSSRHTAGDEDGHERANDGHRTIVIKKDDPDFDDVIQHESAEKETKTTT